MTSRSEPSLSLYKIDLELIALMRQREDFLTDADMTPAEIAESVGAIDAELEGYLREALTNRADEVANFIAECKARDENLAAQMADLREKREMWQRRRDRVESTVLQLMQRAGSRNIDDRLLMRRNPPSVEVSDVGQVPAPYVRMAVTMTKHLYDRICQALLPSSLFIELRESKTAAPEPIKAQILSELKQGVAVPGCRLVDDRLRLEIK
jgi:Siphovirus Gp157